MKHGSVSTAKRIQGRETNSLHIVEEEKSNLRAKRVIFGQSGLQVSQVCFGTEHIVQCVPAYGGQILVDAAEIYGVFSIDTDMSYGSHPQVAAALQLRERSSFVISTKTYAKTEEEAQKDLNRILVELNPLYIDIVLLHRVQSGELDERRPALEFLIDAKERGIIRSIGLSTHSPDVAAAAASMPEIEVVYVTLNKDGSRLDSGTMVEMTQALEQAHRNGKGTCVIKILNRGRLLPDLEGSLEWVLQYHEHIDVYCIGFHALWEMREDLRIINEYLAIR